MSEHRREDLVTIYDIAKESGVSATTVSKALNGYNDVSDATRTKIMDAAKALGYVPNGVAQALRTRKSWMIGVIVDTELQVGPHFSGVLEHFRKELESNGYDVMFISRSLGIKELSLKDHVAFRRVDGLLIESSGVLDSELAELRASGLPMVTTDNLWDTLSSINSANRDGCLQAMRHVAGQGHTKIGILLGPDDTLAGRERYRGLSEEFARLGLECRSEWQVECGKFDLDAGHRGMARILHCKERPTAVLASSDLMALGAMAACREASVLVPDEVSILGFDDIDVAAFASPPLTTVRQNRRAIGREAAQSLIAMIDGAEPAVETRVPVELIVRDSCRKL